MRFFLIILFFNAFVFSKIFADPPAPFTSIPSAQPSSLGLVYEVKIGAETIKVPFALFLPKCYDVDKTRRFPVILFLHGAGEGGTDLNGIFIHGPCGVASRTPTMLANMPFILLSPQSTRGWDPIMIKAVMSLLKILPDHYRLDKDRVVVTGLSMGGLGSWTALAEAPELFAGAVPMCARQYPDPDALALVLQNKALWLIVGGADDGAFVGGQTKMNAALVSVGADTQFKIVPGVGHGVWELYYNNPEFYHWIARQCKPSDVMQTQANAFRKLQSEENSLISIASSEALLPDRKDNKGLVAGWDAQWFKDLEFKASLIHRLEPKVEYPDGSFQLPGDVKENFTVRFSGFVNIVKPGAYTFTTAADDGTRLFVGSQKIIDDWNGHGVVEQNGKIKLKSGLYKVTVEYFQGSGGAALSVFWTGPDFTKKIISGQDIQCEPLPK